ncbi:MAG: hypothetical protein GX158_08985 [Bacteroidales bacterium]|nr:hypothetical protein [Bacteroidales bacterium]
MKKQISEMRNYYQAAIVLFFVAVFCYFCFPGNYVLYFQETQNLFLYTTDYFTGYLVKSGGPLEYAARFLEQFYALRFTGALVLSAVLTLTLIVSVRTTRRLIPENPFYLPLALIPPLLLAVMQANYYHLMEYNLAYLVVMALYLAVVSSGLRYRHHLIISAFPVLYYIIGAYTLIFMMMYIVHNICFEDKKRMTVRIMATAIAGAVVFILFRKVFFLQPAGQIIFSPFPLLENPFYRTLFILLAACMVFYPLIFRVAAGRGTRHVSRPVYPLAASFFLFLAAIYCVFRIFSPQTSRVVEIERLVFSGKFEEAVRLHGKKPSRNLIGQYFYNYALSETDQLCERLFAGRQDFSAGALVLPWGGEHLNRGGYFYYSVGLVNEARRWAYEEMTVYGIRPQNMQMLVRTSILNGDIRMAGKYLKILKRTIFYRSWAKEYEKLAVDPELIGSHSDLGPRADLLPRNSFFIQFNEPQNNLPLLLEGNPENRRAIEYYLAGLLLTGKVEIIVNNISGLEESGYTSIPRHIEEAILVYYNSTGVFPDLGGLRMNRETAARFDRYFKAYLAARNDPSTMKDKLEKEFGNTFWYYFHFR